MHESRIRSVEFLDQLVTQIIDDFIVGAAANVAVEAARLLAPMATLYVVVWGYRLMTGHESARSLALEMVRLSAILLLVLNFEAYNRLVKEPLVALPEYMASVVTGADPDDGIVSQLDRTLSSGFAVGARYWSEGSLFLSEMGLYVLAVLIWVCVAVPIAMAAFLVVLSKLYIAVLLVLGPVVVALTLFERTRGYFERWIVELVTRSLVILFSILVPKIMLYYYENNLDAIAESLGKGEGSWASGVVIIFFSIAQVLFYWQIPIVASAIAGGFQLAPFGVDRRIHNAVTGLPDAWMRYENAAMRRHEERLQSRVDPRLEEVRGGRTRTRAWPFRK